MKKDFSEDTSALTALAEKSIGELYGVQDGYSVSPIKYSENIIYKVTFADGEKRVFRLHRPAYHTESELESELIWLDEIRRDTDLTVPALCRGRNGNLLQTVVSPLSGEKYFCDLMSFIEGKTVGDLPPEQLPEKVREIGVITAKLHRQAENRDRSVKLDRMAWDVPSFFGENAVWGSWRNYSGLKPEDVPFFERAEEIICRRLESYGRTDRTYGMIHSDLHFYNIIDDGGKMQIIDFDDCGYGFYLYDLGCTLVTYSESLELLADCWSKGYETVRPLDDKDRSMLMTFVLLRRIVRLAWLSTHTDSDTAKAVPPIYYGATAEMAKKIVSGEF